MKTNVAALLDKGGFLWTPNAPLNKFSHWKIGGPADFLVEPRTVEEIAGAREIAVSSGLPWLVIGHGSNMLFDDKGFRGMIIRLGSAFNSVRIDGNSVYAQAGTWVPSLARATAARGLSGLEHTVGIPGNLGGLIFMNGGSMRKNIGEVVIYVDVLDDTNRPRRLKASECAFSYRHSLFQSKDWIVTGALLRLEQASPDTIRKTMLAVMEERRAKFPLDFPNCGSVFSNDEQLYAQYGPPGMVLDKAGMKGTRVGDAEVSHKHANFIINHGNASSGDVLKLIEYLRCQIKEKTGFLLKCEVRYASPEGRCDRLDSFL